MQAERDQVGHASAATTFVYVGEQETGNEEEDLDGAVAIEEDLVDQGERKRPRLAFEVRWN